MQQYLWLLGIGLAAGILSGMFGIGGGLLIVPALLIILKFPEFDAVGTSLAALLPPVGVLGFLEFYREGYIQFKSATLLAIGLLIGTYLGAKFILDLPVAAFRKVYAGFLIVIGIRMLFDE